jgi:AraC-like DNA-binding protein
MKAQLEPIVSGTGDSFYARRFELPHFDHPLHYHPELELTYVERSSGRLIVGDHIGWFGPGELYFFGANLPHIFSQAAAPAGGAVAEVLHVRIGPAEEPLFQGAEWRAWLALINHAQLGLQFDAATSATAARLMAGIRTTSGLRRWRLFVELAECLVEAVPLRTLAKPGFANTFTGGRGNRMERVCHYILNHFHEELSHRELARRFHMPPASFSRCFKGATRKTLQEFLNELRLGHACRQLADSDATVTEIAFASGFRNLSNFNRRFKQAYGCSPRTYRRNADAHTTPVD